ncbi:5-(carboxyamino)imidazole ribonucleotide mutase [uncultured Ezakiella sp.]|uniref:5-(carboxyamino)imidazole ribonucleotide mutase n=1 Tax=uncultured Ezakiella sp. TaxID=1637529 RepID=UPI0025D77DE2|nr:5-(carboxyamino)imidazole ribonucleotide mutase [uncultured Ezakiella sp.]
MMKVAIIMGSISDRDVMERAKNILDKFGIETHCEVISAHRTPDRAIEFASSARENGIDAIIAIAGKAAHLAGVVAAITTVPVIGVPGKTSVMGGLDSLFSVVQMPKGIPVATVAIDGGENAGLLAVSILSLKYPELVDKLAEYRQELKDQVVEMNEELGK